jgi:cysteine desulfurase
VAGAYFDNNATTPLDPRVREAMLPWLGERVGNPSSAHSWGQAAYAAVEAARAEVAALLGAAPEEIVFTASGTEANNAVVAHALRSASPGDRIVVSAIEHPSILAACAEGEARGVEVARIAPGPDGVVPAERFAAALAPGVVLAALQLANNELGTLQPVVEVAGACRAAGVPLLCDAVQAAGKIAVDVAALGADYLTVGAHKFHGPLGAAALWIRPGAPFAPLLLGGAQERRRRASTVNVPAVVGFGAACRLARRELAARAAKLAALRDRFEAGLAAIPEAIVHGAAAPRLPHTANVAFPGLVNLDLLVRLDLAGYAVSTGPACGSGVVEPTPTLAALGLAREEAIATLRISFGDQNRAAEIDAFLPVLAREVAALRAAAPTGVPA